MGGNAGSTNFKVFGLSRVAVLRGCAQSRGSARVTIWITGGPDRSHTQCDFCHLRTQLAIFFSTGGKGVASSSASCSRSITGWH
jgi:hypothetical protein